ncbi:MAG: hypothetical protein L0332_07755 [Chloroflexi bacterium]|nr:hypothetical protein [Chloroflexota bacterium]MCI0575233.1 hypothetical protein [Chloroflexota bacterium]MCI0648846.1 hypothetical protein [Chloroflexota bacterium]MCI0726601.1 hypothetical protein [Chloroflexota bacterium]
MSQKSLLKVAGIVVLLLLAAVPALAGGWAVTTLDSLPPGEVKAGETMSLGFTVRQHGQTPVHFVDFMNHQPVAPVLLATNKETGETLRVEARPAEEVGRFTVDVTFPSAGVWDWSITPYPFEDTLRLEPLTVTPAAAAETAPVARPEVAAAAGAPASAGVDTNSIREGLRWGAGLLLLLALATASAAMTRRNRALAVDER